MCVYLCVTWSDMCMTSRNLCMFIRSRGKSVKQGKSLYTKQTRALIQHRGAPSCLLSEQYPQLNGSIPLVSTILIWSWNPDEHQWLVIWLWLGLVIGYFIVTWFSDWVFDTMTLSMDWVFDTRGNLGTKRCLPRDVKFGPKVSKIGRKWDKFVTFWFWDHTITRSLMSRIWHPLDFNVVQSEMSYLTQIDAK